MQTYEQLTGARGRNVNYRAPRFRASELFANGVAQVRVNDQDLQFDNLSMTGIAATDRNASVSWDELVRARVPVEVRLADTVAYQAEGQICRVETVQGGQRIAVRLSDSPLDIPRLVAQHEELLLTQDLHQEMRRDLAAVPASYRVFCTDMLHLLRRYRDRLERFRRHAHASQAVPEDVAQSVYETCLERLLTEFQTLWLRGNEIVKPLMNDRETLRAVKRFTELVLTPEFMAGPIWERSYNKPLGYPGDYAIMKKVYDWQREGDDLYGQLLHRLGLEVSECIATRMVMVQQAMAHCITARASANDRTRITSLGCGPAKEVENVLEAPRLAGQATFTLIDQDEQALADTYGRLMPHVARHEGAAELNCLHVSFIQLLKAGAIFNQMPRQHMIYTVGLIDYLSQKRATHLVESLYAMVEPGGLLLVGNMADCRQSNLWPMEFIADWNVIYRSYAEMIDLAAGCAGADVEVKADPTERVWMAYIRKPAQATMYLS
jgi:hypothetical protein